MAKCFTGAELHSIIKYLLLALFLLTIPIESCFVVHYVLYFKDIPMKFYLQMSQNSSFPYIVHLNQPLNLPNNRTFKRQINPAQMSDIKKVEVIYHHGGLYLDNDQFIDYECNKKHICNLTGLYFLDWTDRKERWIKTVPLSWIYSSHPGNETLLRSLEGLDETKQGDKYGPRTVYFSGPSHMQQYRSGMSFVKIPKKCEFHRADRSWIQNKPQNQLRYEKRVEKSILNKFNERQKGSKQKYVKLWLTHTVIYPKNFNIKIQHRIDQAYNHIQLQDAAIAKIKKVIQYSIKPQIRRKLQEFLQQYQPELIQSGKDNKMVKVQVKQQEEIEAGATNPQDTKNLIINAQLIGKRETNQQKQILSINKPESQKKTELPQVIKSSVKEQETDGHTHTQNQRKPLKVYLLQKTEKHFYQTFFLLLALLSGIAYVLCKKYVCQKQAQGKNKTKKKQPIATSEDVELEENNTDSPEEMEKNRGQEESTQIQMEGGRQIIHDIGIGVRK